MLRLVGVAEYRREAVDEDARVGGGDGQGRVGVVGVVEREVCSGDVTVVVVVDVVEFMVVWWWRRFGVGGGGGC